MSQQWPLDLLVDATVTGTSYRKLFSYDISNFDNLQNLKSRVVDDLKAAGAPLETHASEVVLRNYILTSYEQTPSNSIGAKSCALSNQDSWSSSRGKGCRLLAATPGPHVPIGPGDESRHTMLAIVSRQIYDRTFNGGSVLPLEARVKPLAPQALNPSETAAAAAQGVNTDDAFAPASSSSAAEPESFDITVRDFRGRCHLVRVCGDTSVLRLKSGIAAALGCSVVSHWRLVLDGRLLDDELDLADYNLSHGALVEVQMTSHQQIRSKSAGIGALAPSEVKDGFVGGGLAGAAKATFMAAVAPNCGATWGNPVVKSSASTQIAVQVLLPCGRIVKVPRHTTEDVSQFVLRVLETDRAVPVLKPVSTPAGAGAEVQAVATPTLLPSSSGALMPSGGALPMNKTLKRNAAPLHCDVAGDTRRQTGQLKGVVMGQQILAILLAAAAVVMAMAVL